MSAPTGLRKATASVPIHEYAIALERIWHGDFITVTDGKAVRYLAPKSGEWMHNGFAAQDAQAGDYIIYQPRTEQSQ